MKELVISLLNIIIYRYILRRINNYLRQLELMSYQLLLTHIKLDDVGTMGGIIIINVLTLPLNHDDLNFNFPVGLSLN